MQFTSENIFLPDTDFSEVPYQVHIDLRLHFNCRTNHFVHGILVERKVINPDKHDSEVVTLFKNSQIHTFWNTKKEAMDYIDRLNAQPEIINYTPPVAELVFTISEKHYLKLEDFYRKRMSSASDLKEFNNLDILLYNPRFELPPT